MLSDSSKSPSKMASEEPQKNIAKSTKNIKLSGFFSDLWGLNYQSYLLFETTLNFNFGHKTPGGLKTYEN